MDFNLSSPCFLSDPPFSPRCGSRSPQLSPTPRSGSLERRFYSFSFCQRRLWRPPPVLSSYNGFPDTRFSRGTTRQMSWPDGEHYSCPLRSLAVSLLLSLVFTFSWIGGVLSHLNSSTNRSPRFPLKNLCFLVILAVSSLVVAATDTAFRYILVSLGLAESRILHAAPADTRSKTPLISFCTVQPRTLCVARSLAILCLSTISGPGPGELSGFWDSMVFRHGLIPRRGRITTT